ncbi:serine hydrolase [Tropicimonas sp. IMCC34043]|uniref:serine hydrolase domain-containing protein n=1 Tax=Tropicimonas sp. IMCC34043 TaxID=2248760 RepID=UPI000E21DE7B|nr:serine hydrolase [Tropicimonas sp. IMCC34043]
MSTVSNLAEATTLANWRTQPFNGWSFHHVDALVDGRRIGADGRQSRLDAGPRVDLSTILLPSGETVEDALASSCTDAFIVLHQGRVVAERYDALMGPEDRHIVFSVSKSLTGSLAGVLVETGALDPDAPVVDYVPELKGSAWGDASVRHVLDMTVSVRFIEDYFDPQGDVARYRVAMDWNPPGELPYAGGLHDFFPGLPKDADEHGETFHYVSPNSDVLGWILERASGKTLAELMSQMIWTPLGAEADGWITVDRNGAPRTAGGICVRARDLARFGEMMRNMGRANGVQIVPEAWVRDILANGSREAWARGGMKDLFPAGHYRSKWYVPDSFPGAMMAVGIHGQWICSDPEAELTIVKLSSQPLPEDLDLDRKTLSVFAALRQCFLHGLEQPAD